MGVNSKTVAGVLIFVLLGLAGDLALKHGMNQLQGPTVFTPGELVRIFRHVFTTPMVGLGVLLLLGNFLMLLAVLSFADISVVGPARALNYLFLTLLAWLVLKETVPLLRWIGVLFIVAGVALVLTSDEGEAAAPSPPEEASRGPVAPASLRHFSR
jgi:drug/metabolite transporter (DMT)-like permease